jgi:ParB/Sulfiredoxin domain
LTSELSEPSDGRDYGVPIQRSGVSEVKASVDTPLDTGLLRQISIEYRPIEQLKPDPANPRLHSKKQIRQIAKSIEIFGFNVPVLVDGELKVIAGHGRILAASALGMTQLPIVCLDHLTPTQIRAFMIADNRLTENATWDNGLLAHQLRDLSLSGLDFDVQVTGFAMGEIDLRIASLEDTPAAGSDPADILSELSAGPSVSKIGDLWLLGWHRVLCGNALDPETFTALMGAERASMVFTDPPYNVPIDGHASGLGAIHHRQFPMASGEMNQAEFTAFLGQVCCNLAAFGAAGSLHYICMDWRHLQELIAAGREAYSGLKNLCVWVKDNAGMGSLYRSQHELVLVFKRRGGSHHNNVQLGQFGRNRSNVCVIPEPIPSPAAAREAISWRCTRR